MPRILTKKIIRKGVPSTILTLLQYNRKHATHATLRAKKAVACLYYISATPMEEIERAVTQFGGAFDGSAGPIRSVTSRTCDVLQVIARAAELLHAGLDLLHRTDRLLLRLDLGI